MVLNSGMVFLSDDGLEVDSRSLGLDGGKIEAVTLGRSDRFLRHGHALGVLDFLAFRVVWHDHLTGLFRAAIRLVMGAPHLRHDFAISWVAIAPINPSGYWPP